MLHQPAYKAMMYGFGCGMLLERFQKFFILYKQFLQKCIQIGILHSADHGNQLGIHIIRAVLTYWKIICRIVLTLACFAHTLDIQLHSSCKAGHVSHDFNVIQCVKIINSKRIRIPDLSIHHSSLILEYNILIRLSVLGHSRLLLLTQINATDPVAFMQLI